MERLDQSFSTGMLVIITDAWTQPQLIKYDIPSRVSVLKKKKKDSGDFNIQSTLRTNGSDNQTGRRSLGFKL